MKSIRRQLTREFLVVMLLLVGSGLGWLYFAAREAVIEQFDSALRAKALAVGTLTHVTPDGVRVEFSDRFLRGFGDSRPRDFFEIWDAQGKVIARSESLQGRPDLPWRDGTVDRPAKWNFALPSGRPVRAISFVFTPKPTEPSLRGHEPPLRAAIVSDRDELDETLWGLLGTAAATAGLLIVAILWLVPRVLRRGLKSLAELGEHAAGIDAHSLGERIRSDHMPAELQPIAERLNDAMARLQASFDRERRFSADLAHELRTPLAELRSVAECALKWPESRDAATDRETVAIVQHMERIVAHLLALARAEQMPAQQLTPVALDEIVRESWQHFAARAEARRQAVTLSVVPAAAPADPALLRAILTNLFDNAIDYAPENGSIDISVQSVGDTVEVRVANAAPDFAAADVTKLFDRFWRKEEARTSGQHVGIGLSLARGFAEAMHWSLTAKYDAPTLTFTLRAPDKT